MNITKRIGAAVAVAGIAVLGFAAPAQAYSTDDCYHRETKLLPYQTLVEQVCFVDFSWAEEKLFPGFQDGEKVMGSFVIGPNGAYNHKDTWWPDTSKNA